ncbi:MAG TPA: M28 family peptidase [Thermoanaerobaculia bacterium]
MKRGWQQLLDGYPWFRGAGRYPLPAYSEFMPPPRVGRKPCGEIDRSMFVDGDDDGWHITAEEESRELRPGLEHIGAHLLRTMQRLGRRDPAHGISRGKLENNPYWPDELQKSGPPKDERYVIITSLALSRTQDDKGRVRWTLFGGSDQGPGAAFMRSQDHDEFLERLLKAAFNDSTGFHVGIPRSLRGIRYVLTFEPFAKLPQPLRDAYRAGDIHLLPFPGSLAFWGVDGYVSLSRELSFAMQIPLLQSVDRHEAPGGIRVPQSGWLHERTPDAPDPHPHRGPYRQTFQRTHRWAKVGRDEDELDLISPSEDNVVRVLFSTNPDDLGLYGKPMARNAQIWTAHHELVLDGPRARPEQLRAAAERVRQGGTFGYRFLYPPMQVGWHQVFWHRPVAGFIGSDETPHVMPDAPLGYLTAYDVRASSAPIELWPRIDKSLSKSPKKAASRRTADLTFALTATREFEVAWWKAIEMLAMGRYLNKDNADCSLDAVTQKHLKHHERDLEPLAQMLLAHYRQLGCEADALPFHWQTDFPFDWSQGWLRNQGAEAIDCDVIVRIPGRNRKRAVILADHYDTAYMEDVYGYPKGGGPRLSSHGADDNDSATATLMLAAPVFLQISRDRRLECDVWLVHLTGEEFPADCLGARALVGRIVEGTLAIELSGAFVMDMIAHNNDKARDIFQISPGEGARARELAAHASAAARTWNELPQGERRGRGKRSTNGRVPAIAEYPRLRGEVRPHNDPRSTLYNTDAQIFSDAGLPVVLFMENYDINRSGYHDSHDTMENIDLDYGTAVAAIAIETVARVAAEAAAGTSGRRALV